MPNTGRVVQIDNYGHSELILTVSPSRTLRWRTELGVGVMRLGAWIMTIGLRVEDGRET